MSKALASALLVGIAVAAGSTGMSSFARAADMQVLGRHSTPPVGAAAAGVSMKAMCGTENCGRPMELVLIRAITIRRSPIITSGQCGPIRAIGCRPGSRTER